MKLMIDIDEELYEAYKGNPPMLGDAGMDMIAQAIANGIPLPKGHGRLIDADALITELETDYHNSLSESGAHLFVEITNYIDDAETIVEVDKG